MIDGLSRFGEFIKVVVPGGTCFPVPATFVPEQALAQAPCLDADCAGLIGVNVYGS